MKKYTDYLFIAISLFTVIFWWVGETKKFAAPIDGEARIVFLDIGQGDSTFFTLPHGKSMLVDCGKNASVLEALGRHMAFMNRTINYLVVTHPDLDHYGGCADVLRKFDVEHIILNGDTKDTDSWSYFLTLIEKEKALRETKISTSTEILSDTFFEWLYPNHSLAEDNRVPGYTKDTGSNNGSIVFRITVSGVRILMTGDAEDEEEQYLVHTASSSLRADILKVGHHGSAGSTSRSFVEAVRPTDSIISVGKDNSYGHPSPRVLNRLSDEKSNIWRTDTQGDIMVVIDSKGLRIEAER